MTIHVGWILCKSLGRKDHAIAGHIAVILFATVAYLPSTETKHDGGNEDEGYFSI